MTPTTYITLHTDRTMTRNGTYVGRIEKSFGLFRHLKSQLRPRFGRKLYDSPAAAAQACFPEAVILIVLPDSSLETYLPPEPVRVPTAPITLQKAREIRAAIGEGAGHYVYAQDQTTTNWHRIYQVRVRKHTLEGRILTSGNWFVIRQWEVR